MTPFNRSYLLLLRTAISLIIILHLMPNTLIGQSSPSIVLPSITLPNTPEAASLGKFGEGNTSTYTGALNISIPLYTIQGRDLKETVSLSYDGSGNKVANLPTWVGLGWTLSNGGVITRSMNGMPDLNSNYYSKADQIKPESTTGYSDLFVENDYMYSVANRDIETEPDVYYFNFGGYSGRFYIDARKNIYQVEKKDITIQPIYGTEDITAFTIKDMMGNIYEFTALEVTDATIECSETGQCNKARYIYNSSWYLSKVTSANQTEVMDYEYETQTVPFTPPINLASNQSMTYNLTSQYFNADPLGDCCIPPPFPCGENITIPSVQKGGYTSQTSILNRKFLTKISYRLNDPATSNKITIETLEFQSSANDKPFAYGGKKLDKIIIKKGENGLTGILEWQFTYSSATNRLTLDKVQQVASGGAAAEEPYNFIYNTTSILPDPTSSKIDFWGYYNSNPNLSGLIPSFTYNGVTYAGQNANRNTDTTLVKAGILTKVIYPTKGYTEYYYETHKVSNYDGNGGDQYVGGLRIKEIKNFNYDGSPISKKYYRYIKEGTLPNDANNSSGKLLTRLDFVSFPSNRHYPAFATRCDNTGFGGGCHNYPEGYDWLCTSLNIRAANNTPLGSEQLGHVGYDRVEEIFAGKTIYYYRHGNNGQGDLTKTITYDDQNKKLTETLFTYSSDINETRNLANCNGYKVEQILNQDNALTLCQNSGGGYSWNTPLGQLNANCTAQRSYSARLYRRYYLIAQAWKYLASKTEKQYFYDAAGVAAGDISIVTNFTYGNTKVTQPTNTAVINSDGKTYSKIVRFTEDASPLQTAMVAKGMFGIPIEVEEQVDGALMKKVRVEYSTTQFPNSIVMPYRFYEKFNASMTDLLRITIQSYDKYGNLLELKREYDQPVSAIWSNYNSRIAAKVVNAAQNKVAYTGFETAEPQQGNWAITGATNIQYNGTSPAKTGAGCFGTQSGTFTKDNLPAGKYLLSYYTKSSSAVSVSVTGGSVSSTTTDQPETDGWIYVEKLLDCTSSPSSVTVNTSGALLDELRLYPSDALMTTASYDRNSTQVKGISNESNLCASFEYDQLLRLIRVKDFNGDYVGSMDYSYKNTTNAYNLIKSRVVQTSGINTTQDLAGLSGSNLIDSYKYFDGIGRPIQQIDLNQSPTQKDVVSFMEYDQFGREVKKYLPYAITEINARTLRPNASTEQQSFYTAIAEGCAYHETILENSPSNRPKQEYMPGCSFRSKPGSVAYGTNTANEVRNFKTSGYYAANSLLKLTKTDPDGKVTISYTDKVGRTLLSVMGGEKTYTLYYDHGGIQAVLPPNASALLESNTAWTINSGTEGERLYKYNYDPNNTKLVVSKQIPGSNLQYLYYDRLDRLVLAKDGNGIQLFTKYDILSRPVLAGKYNGGATPALTDGMYESPNTTAPHYYSTANSFPNDGLIEIYTALYYDQYDINRDGSLSSTDEAFETPPVGYDTPAYRTRGKKIASKVAILPADGTAPTQYLMSFTYYDKKLRVVQSRTDNHLGGKDKTYQQINFPGWQLKSRRVHTVGANTTTIDMSYAYDHSGRLLQTSQSVNGAVATVLSQQDYDERSLLKTKKLHQTSSGYLQTLDYTYNIQGWLSRINDPANLGADLFGMELGYQEGDPSLDSRFASGQNANYAGNITLMKWNVQGSSTVKTFGFLYDPLNRIKEGIYADKNIGGIYTGNGNYANAYSYDRDGNLSTLTRNGRKGDGTFNQIDNMTYTSNTKGQVTSLLETADATKGFITPTPGAAQTYTYDGAGNLTRDEHKKMTIYYNALNLPRRISFDNGGSLYITYDAGGVKLKKQALYPAADRPINNLPIASGTYTAVTGITSTGRVDAGSNVTFKAATSVLLSPGFEVKQGGVFLGKVETSTTANYTQDYLQGIEYLNASLQAIYNTEGRLYYGSGTSPKTKKLGAGHKQPIEGSDNFLLKLSSLCKRFMRRLLHAPEPLNFE